VDESTTNAGVVAPKRPTARAVADAEVITPNAATAEPPTVVLAGRVALEVITTSVNEGSAYATPVAMELDIFNP
jgi:hypothetical protein